MALKLLKILMITSLLMVAVPSMGQGASAIPANYQSNPAKEFIMSCTYGVLAGTLVGAAILAFEDQPGDNLNKVARGASIGLYSGILLGLYVVYIVPGEEEEINLDPYNQPGLPPLEGRRLYAPPKKEFRAAVLPTFNETSGVDGAAAVLQWKVF